VAEEVAGEVAEEVAGLDSQSRNNPLLAAELYFRNVIVELCRLDVTSRGSLLRNEYQLSDKVYALFAAR